MSVTASATRTPSSPDRVTVLTLASMKARREPIVMVTAYDYPQARAVEDAGLEVILVGDSLGMVVLGYANTLSVTMEEMLHHCRPVSRGVSRPLLVGDMPFMSYQVSVPEAVRNAGRFLQEGGMDSVKLEGGNERLEAVRAIVDAGIPVMGHLGLTPQSVHRLGGFRTQGKTARAARRLLDDALRLEDAGCFSLVLESVPSEVAALVTSHLSIPTIGIGAGPSCDGQVLVYHDLLGLYDRMAPRFVRRYAEIGTAIDGALRCFGDEVRQRRFPAAEHSTAMDPEEHRLLQETLQP